ncbi:MAG: hypothetical protein V4654_03285 [Bdellovibrionota bacterium]
MHKNIIIAAVLVFGFTACTGKPKNSSISTFAMVETIQIEHTYKSLKILDLDQMSDLLYEKANDYKRNNRLQALREGTMIAFARPNEEVILDKIVSIVRSPLEDADEWEGTVEQMVGQAVQTIRDESAQATDQVTASVVLENVLSEFKPAFVKQYQSGGFETTVIERIAASDLHFSKPAEQEKKLNQMKSGLTPSRLAQKLVEIKNKKLEELKEAEAKKKK